MIKVRAFEQENDFLLMQNLIRENYLYCQPQLYPSPADLDYWRYIYDETPDGVNEAMLWFDEDNHLVAFAWMNEEALDFVCHYHHPYLLKEIIKWSETERLKSAAEKIYYCLYIFDCDLESESIVKQMGWIGNLF